jgi:SAM-dependent methyltransferase
MSDDDMTSSGLDDADRARAWIKEAARQNPIRQIFFADIAGALGDHFDSPFDVLDLGSGDGALAEVILQRCDVQRYVALDLSPAMLAMARERLAAFSYKLRIEQRDFRTPDWAAGLGLFNAVVMLQSAHEMGLKDGLPRLLAAAASSVSIGGLFLYGDYYAELGSSRSPDLYLPRDAQPVALKAAGLARMTLLRDEGGVALYSATRI